jgi:hypothetical protein
MSVVTLPSKLMRGGVRDRAPAPRHHEGQGTARRRGERGLQVGFLLAFAAQLSTRADIETLYDMATVNGARLMRLESYGLEVGGRADLVVVEAPSVQEAYRTQPPRLAVIHDGRLVAKRGRISDRLTRRAPN